MTWEAAGGVLGGAVGAFSNKRKGPSLAQNTADMYGLFGNASGLTAAGGYRDLGPAQFYPGQTYAGLSPQTQQAIQQIIAQGSNSPVLGAANQYMQGAAGGRYLNSSPANAGLSDIAGGAGSYWANPSRSGFDYFGSGGELGNNPYLDSMYGAASRSIVDQFRNSIAPSLASTFSAAGRTGSGAAQGAFGQATQSLGNTLGDLGANLYGSAYESGRNRQLSALGTQGNLYNTGIGNQQNALDSLSRNYAAERSLQQQAAGMAPQLNAATLTGLQAALQGGQALDADAQARINADRERFDFGQQAPRDYYSNLVGLYGGQQPARIQGQQPQPYNALLGGLGGALAGSRIGGLFGDGSLTDIFGFGQQGQSTFAYPGSSPLGGQPLSPFFNW